MNEETGRIVPGHGGLTYREIMERDGSVAAVLAVQSNPPQSTADIPLEHFTSKAFFALEMEKVWPKTWQFVCREEHVLEPGDYFVYDIGDHSILIVRTPDGALKGYHNSCLHRGTKLKPSGTSAAFSASIQCPFHGWTWELDGTLNEVPCSWEFQHLNYEANRLPEVKVDTWNGFVLINMDENAPPLLDYLEVVPEHFAKWSFENWYTCLHIVKELNCNWKVAMESFMEAYHTPTVHPKLTTVVGDWNMQHDIFGDHVSRDLCPMGVSSPTLGNPMSEQELLDHMFLGDPETSRAGSVRVPEGGTARGVVAGKLRERMAADYAMDLSDLTDAEVIDSLKYNIFPNAMINGSPGLPQLALFRPIGMEVDRCVMEFMMFRPYRIGGERPDPAPVVHLKEEELYTSVAAMDPFVAAVFDEDTQIVRWHQEGMRASKKKAATLSSYQESRIRRVHETLEKYINR